MYPGHERQSDFSGEPSAASMLQRRRADTTRPPSHPSLATTETLTMGSGPSSPLSPNPFLGFDRVVFTPPPFGGEEADQPQLLYESIAPESQPLDEPDLQLHQEASEPNAGPSGLCGRPEGGNGERNRRHGAQRGAHTVIPSGETGPTPNIATPADNAHFSRQPPPAAAAQYAVPLTNQGLAAAFSQAIETLAEKIRAQPFRTPRLPNTYTGSDWEDPKAFLADAEGYCRRERIEYCEWTPTVADRLRGPAHAWYDHYRALNLDYHSFRRRLLERFDSLACHFKRHSIKIIWTETDG